MWIFNTSTGALSHNGEAMGQGYSGGMPHTDDPFARAVGLSRAVPPGRYSIGVATDHTRFGTFCMRLFADQSNDMQGRSGFRIRGDLVGINHGPDDGDIILPYVVRTVIARSQDRDLTIICNQGEAPCLSL